MRQLKDDYIQTEIANFRNLHWVPDSIPEENQSLLSTRDRPVPPTKSFMAKQRAKRLYEAKMVDVVIEIVAYLMYLFLCLLITYGHRDPDAYLMTKNVNDVFVKNKFDQVRMTASPGEIWRNESKIQAKRT